MREAEMILNRRCFLKLAAGAVTLPASSSIAVAAQAYPSRPVRIIVPLAPGGATDIIARLLGQRLTDRLGQPFVVENRSGGGGNIGTEAVVRADADGYTLLLVSPPNLINATLYDKLNFNFVRDIAPIAEIIRPPLVMSVNPSVPAKTVPEFIAYAKGNPGKVNMASAGIGSGNHVAGELFKMLTGVHMVHVPYRGGGPALADLVAGQVQVMFGSMISMISYVQSDALRPLAVTSAVQSEALPGVPTVAEFVPGYEAIDLWGLGGPKDTPTEIVDKLNAALNAWLADPKVKLRLADFGGTPVGGSPADFGNLIADETEKWAKVIRFAGIKPE
jgi:tripartite-type tricarboxylate transporter receptor subunit TctC